MNYLLRAAQRLQRDGGSGFALTVDDLGPVHYCWISDFAGFFMGELKTRLTSPVLDAVMIFDCWTPRVVRGHGYYGAAISRVAEYLSNSGKAPWIFSATENASSVRGIERSGFQRRYSLARRKILGWQQVRKLPLVESSADPVSN